MRVAIILFVNRAPSVTECTESVVFSSMPKSPDENADIYQGVPQFACSYARKTVTLFVLQLDQQDYLRVLTHKLKLTAVPTPHPQIDFFPLGASLSMRSQKVCYSTTEPVQPFLCTYMAEELHYAMISLLPSPIPFAYVGSRNSTGTASPTIASLCRELGRCLEVVRLLRTPLPPARSLKSFHHIPCAINSSLLFLS